jgi:uncharacterized protein YutE (UPF0331/DUF86 family)
VNSEREQFLETMIKTRALDALRHLRGLQAAAAAFGADFDLEALQQSWASDDPQELLPVYAVQGGFENVLNTCVKIAQELCELEGWSEPGGQPSSVEALKLLQEHGVITGSTRQALKDAQERRTTVQHAYVHVAVSEVHQSATAVLEHAPLLLQDVAGQLRQRRG